MWALLYKPLFWMATGAAGFLWASRPVETGGVVERAAGKLVWPFAAVAAVAAYAWIRGRR